MGLNDELSGIQKAIEAHERLMKPFTAQAKMYEQITKVIDSTVIAHAATIKCLF